MQEVLEYLVNRGEQMDLGFPLGYDCTSDALVTCALILEAGNSPRIIQFEDRGVLIPKRFKGRGYGGGDVEWEFHDAAFFGGYVFDPVAGRPLHLREYPTEVFDRNVNCMVLFYEEDVRKAFAVRREPLMKRC